MWKQLLLALFATLFIVFLARKRGALTSSGGWGATLIGTLIFGLGGWAWGSLLLFFFISSSLLSHFKEGEKKEAAEKFDKGHKRDFGQTMANGGVGAILALLLAVWPASTLLYFGFMGVMATVTADTWATELGTLSKRPPWLITTGRAVPVGSSGGVSVLGTMVSLLGGLVIGGAAGIFSPIVALMPAFILGGISGLAGSLFDSLLGATVQQIFFCDICQKETEKRVHCRQPTRPIRGWQWLNNDLVNLIASIVGGVVAVGGWLFWMG